MRSASLWLGCVLAIVIAAGCERAPARVRIVVEMPGADTEFVDSEIAQPILDDLWTIPELRDVRAHSYGGRAEFYATFDRSADQRAFLSKLTERLRNIERLPFGAEDPVVESLAPGDLIPIPPKGDAPTVRIRLDRDRADALGLPIGEAADRMTSHAQQITDTLRERGAAAATEELERLRSTTIRVGDADVPLSELATFEIVTQPICIARDRDGIEVPSFDQ
ncbi:MAG: efflux RND transporter permease subunit [Planctomycetales bacterium]